MSNIEIPCPEFECIYDFDCIYIRYSLRIYWTNLDGIQTFTETVYFNSLSDVINKISSIKSSDILFDKITLRLETCYEIN